MKAKLRGTTGVPFEVIEVSCHIYSELTGKEGIPFVQYYADGEGNIYKDEELDFNLGPPHPEATISGWVARDEPTKTGSLGNINLFKEFVPKRDRYYDNDKSYGFWYSVVPCIKIPIDSFPSLTWHDEPIEVEITIKPKK